MWVKPRHWWIICSDHQFPLHLSDSMIPSYALYNSTSNPIYRFAGQYHLLCLVCFRVLEVYHHWFEAIFQKSTYILLIFCMNSSIMENRSNHNLLLFIIILTIFKHTWLTILYVDYNQHLNTLELIVFKVFILHENKDLLNSVNFYDLSPRNKYWDTCH